ncbi:uncharacterized protein LOC121590572 [Anopheles merus]|uniref:uncharacterized protein LOC121590572 n=1 Tax=Anopheles merus TaxID=30066 RepID=UPI001BE4CBAC|nr:uncharacterized protein LOC121590572 [Anopheles merus]
MLEYVYEMQRIARDTKINDGSVIECIVDGVSYDAKPWEKAYKSAKNGFPLKQQPCTLCENKTNEQRSDCRSDATSTISDSVGTPSPGRNEDGSVQNGYTGIGIYYSIDNSAIRQPEHTSAFTAEAIARVIAADKGLRRDKPNVIFTDSASVLQALYSGTTPNIQQLCNIPNTPQVTFFWIYPGIYAGIQENEIADRLANIGRNRNSPACCHNTHPRRDFIRLSKTIIANSWNGYWVSSGRFFLRTIKTTTSPWKDHLSHQDQGILSRLHIGHTRFSLNLLLQKSSPPL